MKILIVLAIIVIIIVIVFGIYKKEVYREGFKSTSMLELLELNLKLFLMNIAGLTDMKKYAKST